jgi:uncharacterized BrkB/YihY/UPF0761 family membrane protein
MATRPVERAPRWYGVPVRIALVTFIGTLLSFALSLLLGIVGTVIVSAARHAHPDMRVAYRQIALPLALIVGILLLIFTTLMELRHYRQAKTLSALERLH